LAAAPGTSVLLNVDVDSSFATQIGGQAIVETNQLRGIMEVGLVTVLSRHLLFNVTTGIGFTPATPTSSLPSHCRSNPEPCIGLPKPYNFNVKN
jgi:hypothetical protein